MGCKTCLLTRIATDHPARVRLYERVADVVLDAARAIGTDPTEFDGVILEVVTSPGELAWDLSPQVVAMNMDNNHTYGLTVTNLSGAGADITTTFTILPLES